MFEAANLYMLISEAVAAQAFEVLSLRGDKGI